MGCQETTDTLAYVVLGVPPSDSSTENKLRGVRIFSSFLIWGFVFTALFYSMTPFHNNNDFRDDFVGTLQDSTSGSVLTSDGDGTYTWVAPTGTLTD